MNSANPFIKGPMIWILAAGVLIGAGATASVVNTRNNSSHALKSPQVSISSPRPVGQVSAESLDLVKSLDESFANLAEAVAPAVVHIRVQNTTARNNFGERQLVGGEGSGFIFRPDGYIVTNDHVVGGFEKVTVILYDGREFPGTVMRAEDSDIAVVKIEARDLPSLPFADSNQVRAGEFAIAIGAPYGLENTVTVGHISATRRSNQITDPNTGRPRLYSDLIQTDTAINVGNSGGPLLNIEGQVVGINSAIFSPTGTSGGIGFAISSNQARLLAETLIEKGKITRGFLGIRPENLKLAKAKDLGVAGGAYVASLPNDGPAAMAGIKQGDVVVRIGNVPVESQVDLRNAMIKYGPGSKVDVEVVRDRQNKTFTVAVKEPPAVNVSTPQSQDRMPEIDIEDFPGFKDFPRVPTPDGIPSRPNRVRLGIEVGDADDTAIKTHKLPNGTKGAVVNAVTPGSVASKLGLQVGDLILELDGKSVGSASDLSSAMQSVRPGQRKSIKFMRIENGARIELERTAEF